jgi:nicotinate-nucleotide pyrophosphorylase (carboxylating)
MTDDSPDEPVPGAPPAGQAGPSLAPNAVRRAVALALAEDAAWRDVTTGALVPPDQQGRAVIIAKAPGVLAGLAVAEAVFHALEASLTFEAAAADGARLSPGQLVARIDGALNPILRGERVALNFLQRLSGVATATARLVEALEGLPTRQPGGQARLLDTRKTTPGLRALERYAVQVGGGHSHRFNLADGILIKDNHLAALKARGQGVAEAVRLARLGSPHTLRVEIEVTSVDQALEALAAGAEVLLLDNMDLEDMRRVADVARGRALTEASGGITLDNARAVAETGVNFISVGAITHSAPALDMSLEVVEESERPRSGPPSGRPGRRHGPPQ